MGAVVVGANISGWLVDSEIYNADIGFQAQIEWKPETMKGKILRRRSMIMGDLMCEVGG